MNADILERLKKHVERVRHISANGLGRVEWEDPEPELTDEQLEDGVLSSMCVEAVEDIDALIEAYKFWKFQAIQQLAFRYSAPQIAKIGDPFWKDAERALENERQRRATLSTTGDTGHDR